MPEFGNAVTIGGRPASLVAFAAFFIVGGVLHFIFPAEYARIVPSFLPAKRALVFISGAAEILGGVGLIIPATQCAAAYGLAALLLAVFPANVYMAVAHLQFPGWLAKSWVQWLRLPLQIPLIWWALQYAKWRD